MNRQSQWLFKAPFVLESDRYAHSGYYYMVPEREAKEGPFTLAMRPRPKSSNPAKVNRKIDFTKEGKKAAEKVILRKELKDEYLRNCSGVDVLKTLSRESLSPLERVKKLERKLKIISRLVQGQKLRQQVIDKFYIRKINKNQLLQSLQGISNAFPELTEFPFPPGYAVRSEARERAIV
jgi:hypothetical protein